MANTAMLWHCDEPMRGLLAHLMSSDPRWKLRAWTRTSSGNGGLSFFRCRSKCAELERAWTPLSVRLEMDTATGLWGFRPRMASCRHTSLTISVTSIWRQLAKIHAIHSLHVLRGNAWIRTFLFLQFADKTTQHTCLENEPLLLPV